MAIELVASSAPLRNAEADIRRYCGLSDPPEIWAYHYYDARPSTVPDVITPEDVLATAAFATRFTRACLQGWHDVRDTIADLPSDQRFDDLTDEQLDELDAFIVRTAERVPNSDRTMVSQVLHRKRPALVPLYDRIVADRYVRNLHDKRYRHGPALLTALQQDLHRNTDALDAIHTRLARDLEHVPTKLRLFDIAIWMEARGN